MEAFVFVQLPCNKASLNEANSRVKGCTSVATAEADISKQSDTYRPGTVVTFLGRASNRVLHAQDNHDEQESAERLTEVSTGLSSLRFKNSKL